MALPDIMRIAFEDKPMRLNLVTEGWREVEVLETWEGPAPPLDMPTELIINGVSHVDALCDLAARSFTFDRLHADPLVDRAEADGAKRQWVRDALDDTMRVVSTAKLRFDKRLAGFLIWKRIKQNGKLKLLIDLLAVGEEFRRHGVARALVAHAANKSGLRLVRAGTQETNEPARKFYASLGMKVVKRQRTFHR